MSRAPSAFLWVKAPFYEETWGEISEFLLNDQVFPLFMQPSQRHSFGRWSPIGRPRRPQAADPVLGTFWPLFSLPP